MTSECLFTDSAFISSLPHHDCTQRGELHTHTRKKGGAGLTLRFIFSPNLRRRNSYSHSSVNVSFEDERRRGQRVPPLPRFPPPPLRSPPVKYADTAAHEAARGFVARIGSAATSQRFKSEAGFSLENSRRSSGSSGGERDCLLQDRGPQSERI